MYVGKAINPKNRISEHLKEARAGKEKNPKCGWIRSLLDEGRVPTMIILEECDLSEAAHREFVWVAAYNTRNPMLTNFQNKAKMPQSEAEDFFRLHPPAQGTNP